jgi:hypothetical protein
MLLLSVACIMVSLFVVSFTSALFFSSTIIFLSSLHSATAYQCHVDAAELCPGICCQRSDPYQQLTGPTCQIQAVWFALENGTWVWLFPTFRFSYYWFQEDIMGGTAAKEGEKDTTEVVTLHPSWESPVNEETNSGIFFLLLNVHIGCALGTIVFCLCIMICILLSHLGYCRFCHPPKRKDKEATATTAPPTCATCSSCSPPSASLRPWDREAMTMEDKYYASMRQQRDDFDDFGFAPHQRYDLQPRCYKQQRYEPRQRYNGGRIVDPVEQL